MASKPTYVRKKCCVPLYILCLEFSRFGADDNKTCIKVNEILLMLN